MSNVIEELQTHPEMRLKGLPISDGVAMAPVCLFNDRRHGMLPVNQLSQETPQAEQARLEKAIAIASARLDEIAADIERRLGPTEAAIFAAQKSILYDPQLMDRLLNALHEQRLTAETAASNVLEDYQAQFASSTEPQVRQRATDVVEVRHRLLDELGHLKPELVCSGSEGCRQGRDRIVVAEELTPSLTVELDARNVLGLVTERGGINSHAAILARALGIPAVTGLPHIHEQLTCDTPVLIDGREGLVIVWPRRETVKLACVALRAARLEAVEPVEQLVVMANINLAANAAAAQEVKAEGIGLYRTEFEFLAAERLLNEDEQYELYRRVVEAMAGRPVYFRLLDVGGDKNAPFFNLRGREPLSRPARQSAAALPAGPFCSPGASLARASNHGPVWVMYPMIVSPAQFIELRQKFEEVVKDLPKGQLKHGPMLEVPSACLQARELLQISDFASIGSNDLVQYLFAVDRNNELVAGDYRAEGPFWMLLEQMVAAARETGKPLSLCGEIAGNLEYLRRLMDAGIKILSVSPRLVPILRRAAT